MLRHGDEHAHTLEIHCPSHGTNSLTITTTPARELETKGIWTGAALGAVIGAVANSALFFGAKAAGVAMTADFQKSGRMTELFPFQPAVASIVPAIFAALFAMLLNRVLAKPTKVFIGVAIVFGLFSMGGPFSLPGAGTGLRAVLALMHVIAGAAITWGIVTKGRRA
jgi:hypothetical protein